MRKPWTDNENAMLKTNKSNQEIADTLGRTLKSVQQQRNRICGRLRSVTIDAAAARWTPECVNNYINSLQIGDEVKVHFKRGDRRFEEWVVVKEKYPYICRTSKGTYQYKELMKWRMGGNFCE